MISRTLGEKVQLILFEPPDLLPIAKSPPSLLPLWFGFQPVDVSPIGPSLNAAYPVSSPPQGQIGSDVCLIVDCFALFKLRLYLGFMLPCSHFSTCYLEHTILTV